MKAENVSVVKISISSETEYHLVSEVVYYRVGTPSFIERWLWFFDYLRARVKVANPKRNVFMFRGPLDVKIGEEWHEYRRAALLKSRNIKLRQLRKSVVNDDFFGFASADQDKKIQEILGQIDLLEKDEYPIPAFPEYINRIHDFL